MTTSTLDWAFGRFWMVEVVVMSEGLWGTLGFHHPEPSKNWLAVDESANAFECQDLIKTCKIGHILSYIWNIWIRVLLSKSTHFSISNEPIFATFRLKSVDNATNTWICRSSESIFHANICQSPKSIPKIFPTRQIWVYLTITEFVLKL